MAQYASSKQEVWKLLQSFPLSLHPMAPTWLFSPSRRSFPATSFPLPQSQLPFIVVLLRGNDVLAYYTKGMRKSLEGRLLDCTFWVAVIYSCMVAISRCQGSELLYRDILRSVISWERNCVISASWRVQTQVGNTRDSLLINIHFSVLCNDKRLFEPCRLASSCCQCQNHATSVRVICASVYGNVTCMFPILLQNSVWWWWSDGKWGIWSAPTRAVRPPLLLFPTWLRVRAAIQGDHSARSKPPVDIDLKVAF